MLKKIDNKVLFLGTAILALFPVAASAQDAMESARAADETLQDITVTAQRRSQSIQSVPIAVTAATAEVLSAKGISNVENISTLSPSISFRMGNNAITTANIQIRGIGTVGNGRTFEGAVGVFVDGVYRTRSGQALTNFLDIDDLQVLRGPQGTLFGKNTSAGALLVNSASPKLGELSGSFEAGYGNLDAYSGKVAINVPLGENAAFRIAVLSSKTDGNIKNPNGGTINYSKNIAVKGQLLFTPADGLNIRLIGDYAKNTGDCCYGVVVREAGPFQPLINALTLGAGLKLASVDPWDREAVVTPTPTNLVEDFGGTIKVDLDLGDGKLSSITALRRYQGKLDGDGDFSGAAILDLGETFKSKFFSQELNYAGSLTGSVNASYVVGAFFSDERLTLGRELGWGVQAQPFWDVIFGAAGLPAGTSAAGAGLFSREEMAGTAKSYAGYMHWDVEIADKIDAIVGARYSRDEKAGEMTPAYFRSALFDPLALAGVMPGTAYSSKSAHDAVSWTAGLQYKVTPSAMAYVTYNRGFKSGGVNLDVNANGIPGSAVTGVSAISQSPTYRPETVDGIELGLKVDWFDRRARTNVALFYNKIADLQVAQFLGLQYLVINAPSAKVYGVELEQTFKISQSLTLNGAFTWLPKAAFGSSADIGILSGRRFSTTPKFAGNASLDLDQPISDSLALTGRIQADYTGHVFTNTTNNLTQDAVTLVNANFGIKSLQSGWQVEAWVKNVFDTFYVANDFNVPLQPGTISGFIGAPRTFGLKLRGSF